MPVGNLLRRVLLLSLLYLGSGWFIHTASADPFEAVSPPRTAEDDRQAIQLGVDLERSRRWTEAIEWYEKTLKQFPGNEQLQYGLRRSKVHFSIDRRYTDKSFLESLLPLSRGEALSYFDDVMTKVRKHYVDPISSTYFVAHGTESLYHALANEKFLATNLPGADSHRIDAFRQTLKKSYWNKPLSTTDSARQTISGICEAASRDLGLRGGAVVMEYIFGGCNALDDYSSYLTPSRLDDLYSNIKGQFVGIGIEMKSEMSQGLLLVSILPESPAEEGGLLAGDHIVAIDGVECRSMTTDEAAGLLQGTPRSRVTLTLADPAGDERTVTLTRRAVTVKSFPIVRMIDRSNGVGYLKMTGFQEGSAAELDAAIQQLEREGMRALIWDVRGNPGGLLTAAVEVLDRFIDDGVLVSTKGRTGDQNWSYSAQRRGTCRVPLVLLVDGDSASASEIVAGAIHDHHRGMLVGRKTFGKWSVQSILNDPSRGTGLRLTTAKFYSPANKTYDKVGVEPDVAVEPSDSHQVSYRSRAANVETDRDIQTGLEILRKQLARR